ncbi:hypothetical protein PENANT_c035G00261 [Penicillium antarcticum]|uniref:Uncharacterized protein n=1 Tax=Penicillium antarcticum TaxID=416450 RepID=A0A1V6PUT3_9EURO|nr:hypothetical protein PENANT_c035G00261 [Penicillium antarcticum]
MTSHTAPKAVAASDTPRTLLNPFHMLDFSAIIIAKFEVMLAFIDPAPAVPVAMRSD